MLNPKIRKAVFPVAGLGTRFLPATKAMPKEMLTVVDRPLIQIAVDEAREAGIEHFIFVTGRNKSVIEDHFDKQFELESALNKRGRSTELDALRHELPAAGQTSFTRQQEPLGLGHAIWCARHLVGNEAFAVILPDMVMQAAPGCLSQMMELYRKNAGCNVLAVEKKHRDELHRYGVVAPVDQTGRQFTIQSMVEKPKIGEAPSNFIISGRYILQPEIFDELEKQEPGASGEIQITDAMQRLMKTQVFMGLEYEGTTYDCGDKVGFFAANVAMALDHESVSDNYFSALTNLLALKGYNLTRSVGVASC